MSLILDILRYMDIAEIVQDIWQFYIEKIDFNTVSFLATFCCLSNCMSLNVFKLQNIFQTFPKA